MTIGIIPCAGTATRIHGIPKYLLPVPDGYLLGKLITRMQELHVQAVIGVNPENAGIVSQYKKTAFVHTAKQYKTMTETVLSCRSFANGDDVLFGMPDTFIDDDACFQKLTSALDDGADVAVGVFYARPKQHLKAGMCAICEAQVVSVVDKPQNTDLRWLWGVLAWKPAFWEHMQADDPHVGYALPRAIAAGCDVRAVKLDGHYWDAGTFDEYAELVKYLHGRKQASEMALIYA